MSWETLYGSLAQNKSLQKVHDTWLLGIKGDDFPYALLSAVIAGVVIIQGKFLFLIPVDFFPPLQYLLGFFFIVLAAGFAWADLKTRSELWTSFWMTPHELNLFSPEYEFYLPITEIKNQMIHVSGSVLKKPSVIAGIKVIVKDNFNELPSELRALRMRSLRTLSNMLTSDTPLLQYIKTKNLDLTSYTDSLEDKSLQIQEFPGMKYYSFFFTKYIKLSQKKVKTKNQEVFLFFETSAIFATPFDTFMHFIRGENVDTFDTPEARVKQLTSIIEVYSSLMENLGFRVDIMGDNDLREFFMSYTSVSDEFSFDRDISLPDNFYEVFAR